MPLIKLEERILHWINERTGAVDVFEMIDSILERPVPKQAMNPAYCLGGIAFFAFLIDCFTGVFLAFYYIPSAEMAYESVKFISTEVYLGSFMRSLHHWSAHLMVAAVYLHMFRVYLVGAYQKPRELNWIIGLFLLFCTLGLGFSGYMLPWDQVSYWASTIGLQLVASVPVIGPIFQKLLLGGAEIGGGTLARFYTLHILVLPIVLIGLCGIHFILVRNQGIKEPL